MSETHFKVIDQTIGFLIVGFAAALFVTPVILMLSSAFVAGM